MGKISFFLLWIGIVLLPVEVYGKKKPKADFSHVEQSIQALLSEIRETKDDSLAIRLHRDIEDILVETLVFHDAFMYHFDSLKWIGKLFAPGKDFRIINWNHSSRDGSFSYFSLMVLPGKKDEPNTVFRFTEMKDSIYRPEFQQLDLNKWLGCLYYTITPKKRGKDGTKYYALLGFDLHNQKTRKKYIEILSFDENGNPQFGAPILEMNHWTKNRVIFEYSAHISMYLEYNRLRRRIEMDHLAPPMPYLVGYYEYYEPDQFRDALKFKRGKWKHIKDIEKPKDTKVKKRLLPKPSKSSRRISEEELFKQLNTEKPVNE